MSEQLAIGLILSIVAGFFAVVGFLMMRTLSMIDRNQMELFGRLQKLELAIVRIAAHLDIKDNKLDL